MSIHGGILLNDLSRMAKEAAPQLGARVAYDPKVISDHEFHVKHGMSREAYAERGARWQRRDFEERVTADLDRDLDAISKTSDSARHKLTTFSLILGNEKSKLSALESRKAQFQEFVNAPTATRSKISDAISRTKAWLLGGGDEPTIDRAALDAELALASHKAQAAEAAIAELDKKIEVAGIRVNRLADAERGFLNDAVAEVASDLLSALARKRGEVVALERLLEPLRRYGVATHGKPEPVELKWRHTWPDVANALRAEPSADVSKLLPRVTA
jgi:hypothetical protein